jgi:hypothetical protein
MQRLTIVLAVTAVSFVVVGIAGATWQVTSTGNGYSKALSMPSGNTPTVSVSGVNVTVSWTGNTIGGAAVDGYTIKRYNTSNVLQSIGSACTGLVTSTSCTESSVPAGRWKYTATPNKGTNWVGTESGYSAQAHVVGAPTAVSCTNCYTNGSKYINSSINTSVSVQVDLPSTSETGDVVHLTLTDGTNTVTPATKAGTAGSGSLSWTAISASTLNQGNININAWVTEGGSTSATTSTSVTKDTVAPTASNIAANNKTGGTLGKMDSGDTIVYTFSEQMDLSSLGGSSVTVAWTNNASNDSFTITSSNYGTVATAADLVSGTVNWSSSTVVQSGSTVTITLGTVDNSARLKTDTVAQNMTWTPVSTAKDLAGNAMSTTAKAETDNDVDF